MYALQPHMPQYKEGSPVVSVRERGVGGKVTIIQTAARTFMGRDRVPASWPRRRDLDAFDRWFEWSFHSMVVDLCDDPLLQEEV